VCAYFHGIADGSLDRYGLYERCWEDDAWSGPNRVAERGTDLTGITTGFAPAFAPDGTLHVAWETPPDEVGYGDQVLSGPGTNGSVQSVTDSDGRLHVLWWNGETGDIDHRWSADEGRTWSEPDAIDHNFTWRTAAVGHGGIHTVSVAGGELTHYHWTVDTGWSDPVDITGDDTNYLTYPGLTGLANGGSAASWVRGDTLVVSKLNDEADPAATVTVPEAEGLIVQSQLAAHDDTLHMAWLTDQGEVVHLNL
jgi:hypothetical protein